MKKSISVSDIFVRKICEKSGALLTRDDIIHIWTLSGGSKSRITYAVSILLGRKFIENISRGLYIVTQKEKPPLNFSLSVGQGDNLDKNYWDIVEKLITIHSPSGGIIGGEKALEFHLHNYSIPDILLVYTRDTALRVKLKDGREVHFRTLISGEKTGGRNLYRILLEQTDIFAQNKKLHFLSLEASLLDALSLRRHEIGVEESTILRFLKSFHMKLTRERLGILVRYRYIRAMNRLRVLSRDAGYDNLYQKTLDIIRDEGGGCYLNI